MLLKQKPLKSPEPQVNRGKLIVVEGIDGTGKSTLASALSEKLHAVKMVYPDRTTFFGGLIDQWLHGKWRVTGENNLHDVDHNINAAAFQAMQTVNRLETVQALLSHLQDGSSVVCDRYWMSGFAYGSADGLNGSLLRRIHALLPQPDLSLLVEVPLTVSHARVAKRGQARLEAYERRGESHTMAVKAAYAQLWQDEALKAPHRWVVIDSTGTAEETLAKAMLAVAEAQHESHR